VRVRIPQQSSRTTLAPGRGGGRLSGGGGWIPGARGVRPQRGPPVAADARHPRRPRRGCRCVCIRTAPGLSFNAHIRRALSPPIDFPTEGFGVASWVHRIQPYVIVGGNPGVPHISACFFSLSQRWCDERGRFGPVYVRRRHREWLARATPPNRRHTTPPTRPIDNPLTATAAGWRLKASTGLTHDESKTTFKFFFTQK